MQVFNIRIFAARELEPQHFRSEDADTHVATYLFNEMELHVFVSDEDVTFISPVDHDGTKVYLHSRDHTPSCVNKKANRGVNGVKA